MAVVVVVAVPVRSLPHRQRGRALRAAMTVATMVLMMLGSVLAMEGMVAMVLVAVVVLVLVLVFVFVFVGVVELTP